MVVQLYGTNHSTCSQRVLTTLIEKEIPYELHNINLFAKDQKAPEHIARQPFGVIPVLVDGDFTIFESRAIVRYLQLQYPDQGTRLAPDLSDVRIASTFEQWAQSEIMNLENFMRLLVREKYFKQFFNLKPDEAQVEELTTQLNAKLDVYEGILSKQDYLGGDSFSIIDVYALPNSHILFNKTGDADLFNSRPNVKAWWERVSSRPSWHKVLALE